jgi:hypothetical protein
VVTQAKLDTVGGTDADADADADADPYYSPMLKSYTTVPLIGSIDQGTSSTRYILFNKQGAVVASAQMEHTQIFPKGAEKVGNK